MMIFYFYLVCFTFPISYSVLRIHLVYVPQFLHLSFFFNVLSQAFIKCSTKTTEAEKQKYICIQKIPRRRKWQPTPAFLPGKPHSPWVTKSRHDLATIQHINMYNIYIC